MKKKDTLYYFFYIFKIVTIIIITIFITLDTVNTKTEKYMNISTKISPIYKEYSIGEPTIVTLIIKNNNSKTIFLHEGDFQFDFIKDEELAKREKRVEPIRIGPYFKIPINENITYTNKIILNKFIKFRSIGEHNITGYYEISLATDGKHDFPIKMTNNFKINLIAKNTNIIKKHLDILYSKTLSYNRDDREERMFAASAIASLDNTEILPYLEKIAVGKCVLSRNIAVYRLLELLNRDKNRITPILKKIKNQIKAEYLKKEISKSLGE